MLEPDTYRFYALYSEAYQQLASISAVLGGLAFTAAASLLASATGTNSKKALTSSAKYTIATALTSAICMVLAALTWSLMSADINREIARNDVKDANFYAGLNEYPSIIFLLGIFLFFSSIGFSGWIASKKLGIFTLIMALLGIILFVVIMTVFIR